MMRPVAQAKGLDTGQAISAALLPHLFQRYQQGKGI